MKIHVHQLERTHSFDNDLRSLPPVAVVIRTASMTDIQVYQSMDSGPMISIVSPFRHPSTGSINRNGPAFLKSEPAEHLERYSSSRRGMKPVTL
ncbi:hypothetical protein [Thalassoglobus neptunius]|uniref:hypothetical protein n=1 Tax=Thalassoglobus neptunius TaxID=1938619 RepID=UPI0011B73841|nr:hypothetical protein [Thalassoglobus neptunius]